MKKAFTIFELLVAMALMVALLAGSGLVFRISVQAYQKATSTAEISRKLLAIIQQLNDDFDGLQKDGEIILMWRPGPIYEDPLASPLVVKRYERFDRIMFFATGDFHSYHDKNPIDGTPMKIQGNMARISYMIAKQLDEDGDPVPVANQKPEERILARVQHIYTADEFLQADEYRFPNLDEMPDDGTPPYSYTETEENSFEYETMTMAEWTSQPWSLKRHMIPVVTDVPYSSDLLIDPIQDGGPTVSPNDSTTVHMLFCEGVGEFSIQGWYEAEQRWVPAIDPDDDDDLLDTDFMPDTSTTLDLSLVSVLIYPYRMSIDGPTDIYGGLWNLKFENTYPDSDVVEAKFNSIPGLGRALKFTFTLYDSKGVFPEGKTFTHIVYLD